MITRKKEPAPPSLGPRAHKNTNHLILGNIILSGPLEGANGDKKLKPEKLERLNASQIDELSKILGVKATAIKEAFRFYFPGATYALEEGLSSRDKSQALLMYSGFKVGYLTAMTVKADPGKMAQALVFLMGLREAVAP